MPHYALKIEYHGGPFAGWQRQSQGLASVQGAVEAALAKLEPRAHTIAAAGRTDAGVHATGQVATLDMERDWDPFRLMEALNHHLRPAPVAILAAARVADDFHARFSALERRYLFRLIQRREIRFTLRARSFLHNQVRSIVGTLERVGAGSWQPEDVKAALDAKDRATCGPVCPPDGLYLSGVGYPVDPFG